MDAVDWTLLVVSAAFGAVLAVACLLQVVWVVHEAAGRLHRRNVLRH